jgi:hypothetical protein
MSEIEEKSTLGVLCTYLMLAKESFFFLFFPQYIRIQRI